MRLFLVVFSLVLLLSGAADVVMANQHNLHLKVLETQETRAGETIFVKLPGNPAIGYKYRLNRNLSTGLELVNVIMLGWLMTSKSQTIFFRKRDVLNVAILAKSPGQVDLAFEYYRRIGGRTRKSTSMVRVIIKPPKNSL